MKYQLYELKDNFNRLRKLFGNRQPSVRRFNEALKDFSDKEKERLHRLAYSVAINEWDKLPVWYKDFLMNLVKRNRQGFLDYIRQVSILGILYIPVEDKKMAAKIFTMLAHLPKEKGKKASYNQIAFIFCLCMGAKGKISHLSDKISKGMMTPEEFEYMKELIVIDC